MSERAAVPATGAGFSGLVPEAVEYLRQLAQHNDTGWFAANRQRYDQLIVEPLRALVGEFAEWMHHEVDPGMEVRPQIGRAIGRIRRDTRFSRDKSPYRDSVWVVFRNRAVALNSLAFYWELTTRDYLYGMGFYAAPPRILRAVRERALAAPERFLEVIAPAEARPEFQVAGERNRRTALPGAPERLVHWLDRKNLYVSVHRPHDQALFGRGLVDLLWDAWSDLVPLYQFLKEASATTQPGAASPEAEFRRRMLAEPADV